MRLRILYQGLNGTDFHRTSSEPSFISPLLGPQKTSRYLYDYYHNAPPALTRGGKILKGT